MNNLPTLPKDDGFDKPPPTGGPSGTFIKWDDARGWHDRDGNKISCAMLIYTIYYFVGRWVDTETGGRKLERITSNPLPDPEELNRQIPESEWPLFNGKPERPYKTYYCFKAISETGASYTYEHCTYGAMMMIDAVREQVTNMRILRGERVYPLAHPTEVPWDLPTGMRKRPVLDVFDYKTPGNDGNEPPRPEPKPVNGPTPAAQAKPKVSAFDHMADVKPVTVSEVVDDEIPY